jgi:hypothetical protein
MDSTTLVLMLKFDEDDVGEPDAGSDDVELVVQSSI